MRAKTALQCRGTQLTIALLAIAAARCGGEHVTPPPAAVAEAKAVGGAEGTTGNDRGAADRREAALRAARVWQRPRVPIAAVDFSHNQPGSGAFTATEEVKCRFILESVGGMTPKFNCELPGGESIKVKYGAANPELYAEVAASRLFTALGFGADRMYLVKKVICAGCPPFPFHSLKCVAETGMERACIPGGVDYRQANEFEPAVIERRFPGAAIDAVKGQGWAWYELDRIDARAGGSPRAEVDALRLLAVLVAHWDNKSENQRLVCLSAPTEGVCAKPFALVHDLGGTFGPVKVDLRNWRAYGVWSDRASCTVSMKSLPYAGATFDDRRISDAGRTLLLGLLEPLSDRQLADLFTGAGLTRYDHVSAEGRDAGAWVAAFKDKVKQIRDGGPCPQ